jgi:tRNA(adenine34) deaminase
LILPSTSKTHSADEWLRQALILAEKAAQQDEVPVGALVVFDNKIVGKGSNRRESDRNPLAHAEIIALQEASRHLNRWRLNECTLIVTLEPCPMCLAASQQARITKIIYGAHDTKGGALSLGYPLHADVRMNHRFEVEAHLLPKCSAILSSFFAKKRI